MASTVSADESGLGSHIDGPFLRQRRRVRARTIAEVARRMRPPKSRERVGQLERMAAGALRARDVLAFLLALRELDAAEVARSAPRENEGGAGAEHPEDRRVGVEPT